MAAHRMVHLKMLNCAYVSDLLHDKWAGESEPAAVYTPARTLTNLGGGMLTLRLLKATS
jgi:hypothetical protein